MLVAFSLVACKENNWQNGTVDGDIDADVLTKNEVDGDLNFLGGLYTEEDKPEGWVQFTLYSCRPKYLTVTKNTSYAPKDRVKDIDYILDVFNVYTTHGTVDISGYLVGDDMAVINMPETEQLLDWLQAVYPEQYDLYSRSDIDNGTSKGFRFKAYGFAMNGMDAINRTIRVNFPNVTSVIFKTSDDKNYYTLGKYCSIKDGIYFNGYMPRFLGSQYNYYGKRNFNQLVKDFSENYPEISNMTVKEQLDFINKMIK